MSDPLAAKVGAPAVATKDVAGAPAVAAKDVAVELKAVAQKDYVQEKVSVVNLHRDPPAYKTLQTLPPDCLIEVLPVEQHNVIIIGESRSGKSTFKKLLQNPNHYTELEVFRGTVIPTYETMLFKLNGSRHLALNIVDTPGFGEAAVGSPQRTDFSISSMITHFAKRELAKISLVLLAFNGAGGLNASNVLALRKVVKILGKQALSKTCFLVTHFEGRTEEEEELFKTTFVKNPECKFLARICQGGFLFTGALNASQFKDVKLRDAFALQQRKRQQKFFDILLTGEPIPLMSDDIKEAQGMFAIQESITTSCMNLNRLVPELKDVYSRAIAFRQKINELVAKGNMSDPEILARASQLVEEMAILGTKESDGEHLKIGDDTGKMMREYERIGEEVHQKYDTAQRLNDKYVEFFNRASLLVDELEYL